MPAVDKEHEQEFVDELNCRGFTLVPQLASPDTVFELSQAVDRALGGESAIKRAGKGYALRNLAMIVPEVRAFAASKSATSLLKSVFSGEALLVRSILFDKRPEANWRVGWHQDTAIAVQERKDLPDFVGWSEKDGVPHVQPPAAVLEQVLTIRLHLDPADEGNGPLEVIPGSHTSGRLNDAQIHAWVDQHESVICHAAAGDALLMRPLLLHSSRPASKAVRRRVVHLEFASGRLPGGLEWFRM